MPAFAPDAAWPSEPQPAAQRAVWFLVGVNLLGAGLLASALGSVPAAIAWLAAATLACGLGARRLSAGELRWSAGSWRFRQTLRNEHVSDEQQAVDRLARVLNTPWGDLLKADARWLWLRAPQKAEAAASHERWRAMQRALQAVAHSASEGQSQSGTLGHG